MEPMAEKLRERYQKYSHVVAVSYETNWAIEIGTGRRGVELLSDDTGKILKLLSEESACGYIAEALEGL